MTVTIKRVYEPPAPSDGIRVLVDRLWPRGLSKEQAEIDEWVKEIAPSNELRRWYHARPDQWQAFRKKYLLELAEQDRLEGLQRLYELAHKKKQLTLLFASKNETLNNAVVLKEVLEGLRKPPSGTGPGALASLRRREAAVRRR